MKKLIATMLTMLLCFCVFAGCGVEVEKEETGSTKSMFIIVEDGSAVDVVYHRETKVMYAVSNGGYNSGNFTLLVNADGTPMLWGE